MLQVTPDAPLFLIAGTDGLLILQAALGGAALGLVLTVLAFAWRLRPPCRRSSVQKGVAA
jgi:hypothetical protein